MLGKKLCSFCAGLFTSPITVGDRPILNIMGNSSANHNCRKSIEEIYLTILAGFNFSIFYYIF